jgi:hypothetical protein
VFLQVFQMHVSSVSSAFKRMLQVSHLNVSKVDREWFQVFFFQMYVASVFIWMLHTFHTYVVNISSRCRICFAWLVFFWCFCKCFICLHMYVVSVASECFKSRSRMFFECFCKCLRYVFQVFHLPSDVCCKCRI